MKNEQNIIDEAIQNENNRIRIKNCIEKCEYFDAIKNYIENKKRNVIMPGLKEIKEVIIEFDGTGLENGIKIVEIIITVIEGIYKEKNEWAYFRVPAELVIDYSPKAFRKWLKELKKERKNFDNY